MLVFGQPTLRKPTVDSTQNWARELAQNGAAPGTVCVAKSQTQGRGRPGKTWFAAEGSVMLTAVGAPVDADCAWQLAIVAGLAVAEAFSKIADVPAQVRFPNDVLLAGRKAAGILIETVPAPNTLVTPLIGIGANVKAANFPPEIAAIATTLEQAAGQNMDVAVAQRAILRQLSLCWDEWLFAGFDVTLARWKARLDPTARRVFILDGKETLCRVRNLHADGTVVLETANGATHEREVRSVVPLDAPAAP